MKKLFDRLNLGPQERRLVVGVLVVLFLIANVWLVWPHFKDWGRLQADIARATTTLGEYRAEVAQLPKHQEKEAKLKGEGSQVASEEMALALLKIVTPKAVAAGINVVNWDPRKATGPRTDDFFDEQTLRIQFQNTGDQELLNFLISLGGNDSIIRVRDLSVKPDPSQTKLMGEILMVASYQKPPPAGKAPAPTSKKQ